MKVWQAGGCACEPA